jgi:hypothetical protein
MNKLIIMTLLLAPLAALSAQESASRPSPIPLSSGPTPDKHPARSFLSITVGLHE